MKKEFVPYEIALVLKELGFNEPCNVSFLYNADVLRWKLNNFSTKNEYPHVVSAPLYQQAFRWFREKYYLDSYLKPEIIKGKKSYDFYIWIDNNEDLEIGMYNLATYEEAQIECLKKLIEISKKK